MHPSRSRSNNIKRINSNLSLYLFTLIILSDALSLHLYSSISCGYSRIVRSHCPPFSIAESSIRRGWTGHQHFRTSTDQDAMSTASSKIEVRVQDVQVPTHKSEWV